MPGPASANHFHPDTFTKEQIKRRLKSRAVQYWDLQEADVDSLDPLVDLLFGACAVEFERMAHEVHDSQSRLLERLAQLMVPEVYTNARPAHAIMHASTDVPQLALRAEDQFVIEKEIQENNMASSLPIVFSPVSDCTLFDASIVCQAVGNKLTFYAGPFIKGQGLYADTHASLSPYTLWLGLKLNKKIERLTGLTLFFDWRNDTDKTKYLPLLRDTQWSVGEQRMVPKQGFMKKEEDLLADFDLMGELEGHVLQYYQQHFLSIGELDHSLSYQQYPQEFKAVFSSEQLKELKEELVWLKVVFPAMVTEQPLHDLYCSLNCFPVMNRKLHMSNRPYTLTPTLNIVPIQTEEHFLSIRHVHSDTRNYRSLSFKEVQEAEDGTYSVRQGGVARFDQRNAASLLNYLYDTLRDESAAFSAFGHHALTAEINSLEQGLSRLQMHFLQRLQQQASKCHLLLHTQQTEDVWVEFWSTQGVMANRLLAGRKASPLTHAAVKSDELILLTTTTGGQEPMNEAQKLQVYKHTLLTRNRVVTEEDIKSACFAELGEKLEQVQIKKGFINDASSKKGFTPTLDVVLIPAQAYQELDWRAASQELQAILERKKMFLTKIQVYTHMQSGANVPG